MEVLQTPNDYSNGETVTSHQQTTPLEEFDSACSTPYVSAPSSPGRGPPVVPGFFYSAPASPVHFMLSNSNSISISSKSEASSASDSSSLDFDFSVSRYSMNCPVPPGSMSSADELFLNGQIRPMKLSLHLQRPQVLPPLIDLDESNGDEDDLEEEREILVERERNFKLRSGSLRRRTRSMSSMRTPTFEWREDGKDDESEMKSTEINEVNQNVEEINHDQESSRSSSTGRSSKRWVFLKEFLYRSKSEGRITSTGQKFWSSMSFSPVKVLKDKKSAMPPAITTETPASKKTMRRRLGFSAHELHYTANRAQAEVMRRKTFLPYSQGLLGCLRFSSKSYGAMNGFTARSLNPVSSR